MRETVIVKTYRDNLRRGGAWPGRAGAASQSSTTSTSRRAGFTLLELLTVVLIIGLLLSILMPSINAIIGSVYAMRTLARIKGLDDGANEYKMDFSYFPGQRWVNPGEGDICWPESYTGSQVMGVCMYGYKKYTTATAYTYSYTYNQIDMPIIGPDGYLAAGRPMMRPEYAPLTTVVFENKTPDVRGDDEKIPRARTVGAAAGRENTLLDEFPVPMAILYFPFRIGKTEPQEAYVYEDNSVYVENEDLLASYAARLGKEGEGGGAYTMADYKAEMRSSFTNTFAKDGPRLRNEGEFLIIGPGRDRLYFTVDDVRH